MFNINFMEKFNYQAFIFLRYISHNRFSLNYLSNYFFACVVYITLMFPFI